MTATADTPATAGPPPTGPNPTDSLPLLPPGRVPTTPPPAWAQVEHALAAARTTGRHPAGSNLRVLAAEVEHLRGMLDTDGDALAWLLIREQHLADAWHRLSDAARGDVPGALADEIVEIVEHHGDPADTTAGRELARLRAVEAAARAWAAEPARLDGADVTPAGDALLDALNDGAVTS